MFENERKSNEDIVKEYKDTVMGLCKYLSWLESKQGANTMTTIRPDGSGVNGFSIPTYDPTLLSFVKALEQTPYINKNYSYIYTRYTMRDYKDELRMIERAQIRDMDLLFGIFSKYVIKGRTKGVVWKEGVENGVYYKALKKCKELIEFWDVPFDARNN